MEESKKSNEKDKKKEKEKKEKKEPKPKPEEKKVIKSGGNVVFQNLPISPPLNYQ